MWMAARIMTPAPCASCGEEIGLQLPAAPQRLFKLAACAETDQEHVWVYRCEAEGPFRLHPEEIERGGWFAPAEVTRWMAERPEEFASALLLIWKRVNGDSSGAAARAALDPSAGCSVRLRQQN